MVIGLLGILKAGGAYLPLDPAIRGAPGVHAGRHRAAVLVTQSGLQRCGRQCRRRAAATPRIPGHGAARRRMDRIERQTANRPRLRARPSATRPTSCTSGTTGTPKGVVVTHATSGSRVSANDPGAWERRSADDAPHLALPFDASARDLGPDGPVVVVPPSSRRPSPDLRDLSDHQKSSAELTPSMFRPLRAPRRSCELGSPSVAWRRRVQWLPSRAIRAPTGRAQLTNRYGPTENTTFTARSPAYRPCGRAGLRSAGRSLTLGTMFWTLALSLCRSGCPGSLHCGAGLARGYLGRAGLTAERFVPDPLAGPAAGCIGPGTWRAGVRTACWSSWGAWTRR